MRSLDAKTYSGLWAAVPTPWTADGKVDEKAIAVNCERLAAARVDGIYTTDSDGEFYAIEMDEFRHLATIFGHAMQATGIDAAMGVTWSSTQGVIDRIRAAGAAGIPNVHVGFPYFMPLTTGDVERFFADLAQAVPTARWIYYAHPSMQPALTGRDYARLGRQFPEQFVGTKLATQNFSELTEIMLHAPHVAHTTVDPTMLPGFMLGAVGVCSYWVNTMPRWQRRFVDACATRRWDEAAGMHKKLMEWELTHVQKARMLGYRHAALGKMRGIFTGFLEGSASTRAPYYPVSSGLCAEIKQAFGAYWAEELRGEGFGPPR